MKLRPLFVGLWPIFRVHLYVVLVAMTTFQQDPQPWPKGGVQIITKRLLASIVSCLYPILQRPKLQRIRRYLYVFSTRIKNSMLWNILNLWPFFRFLVNDLTYTTPRFCIFDSLFRNSPCKASKTIWTCCVWQHCSTWQRYWKRWNYYEHKEIRLHSLCHHCWKLELWYYFVVWIFLPLCLRLIYHTRVSHH